MQSRKRGRNSISLGVYARWGNRISSKHLETTLLISGRQKFTVMERRHICFALLILTAVVAACILSKFDKEDFSYGSRELFPRELPLRQQWESVEKHTWESVENQTYDGATPALNTSSPHWQAVTHRMALIYSAFIDTVHYNKTRIRLVGLSGPRSVRLHCWVYWGKGVVHAKAEIRRISRLVILESTIFDCYLPKLVTAGTAFISPGSGVPGIKVDLIPKASIWDHKKSHKRYKLAVCVMQPVFEWNNWLRLVAFFEYHIALGAEHFVLYEQSWSPLVDKIVNRYADLNLVTVLKYPRKLPLVDGFGQTDTMEGTYYYAQLAALHDCVYRMSAKAKYVALIDLDEYLVVRNQQSLLQILKKHDRWNVGAFLFQSTYALHAWPEIPKNLSVNDWLNSSNSSASLNFENLQRDKYVWPPHSRSKVIVKPATIDLMEEHYVLKFETIYREIRIDRDEALIYHDKPTVDPFKYMSLKQKPMLYDDRTMVKAGIEIVKTLKERLANFSD